MIELSESETHVLKAFYHGWKHHPDSIVAESHLMRRLIADGFDAAAIVPSRKLVALGLLMRISPHVILITDAGIAEGQRLNL